MKRNLCLIFCGEDSVSARSLAQSIRNDEWQTMIVSAYEFNGAEWDANRVIVMPDAPRWQADRIVASYPNAERMEKKKPDVFQITPGERVVIAQPKRRGRPRKIA